MEDAKEKCFKSFTFKLSIMPKSKETPKEIDPKVQIKKLQSKISTLKAAVKRFQGYYRELVQEKQEAIKEAKDWMNQYYKLELEISEKKNEELRAKAEAMKKESGAQNQEKVSHVCVCGRESCPCAHLPRIVQLQLCSFYRQQLRASETQCKRCCCGKPDQACPFYDFEESLQKRLCLRYQLYRQRYSTESEWSDLDADSLFEYNYN